MYQIELEAVFQLNPELVLAQRLFPVNYTPLDTKEVISQIFSNLSYRNIVDRYTNNIVLY